jgi:hypothetical protein
MPMLRFRIGLHEYTANHANTSVHLVAHALLQRGFSPDQISRGIVRRSWPMFLRVERPHEPGWKNRVYKLDGKPRSLENNAERYLRQEAGDFIQQNEHSYIVSKGWNWGAPGTERPHSPRTLSELFLPLHQMMANCPSDGIEFVGGTLDLVQVEEDVRFFLAGALTLFDDEQLTLIDTEHKIKAGRIDILCRDAAGRIVVIELKTLKQNASAASVTAQIQRYVEEIHQFEPQVRGMIVVSRPDLRFAQLVQQIAPTIDVRVFDASSVGSVDLGCRDLPPHVRVRRLLA